jgi:hypothetical protein
MTDTAVDPRLARANELIGKAKAVEDEAEGRMMGWASELRHLLAGPSRAYLEGCALVADLLWSLAPGDIIHVEQFVSVWQGTDVFDILILRFVGAELDNDGKIHRWPHIVGSRMLPGQTEADEDSWEVEVALDDPQITWSPVRKGNNVDNSPPHVYNPPPECS